MKRAFKIIGGIIALIACYFIIVFAVGTITDYKPIEKEIISDFGDKIYIEDSTVYSALIWNIGYAGLGANMDFFYDGGQQVRDTELNVHKNLNSIAGFLQMNDTVDFILLQEVDEYSKRAYGLNMVDHINMSLPEHLPFFAYNYKVKFVPVPCTKPMGKVQAGLLTLSKHIPINSTRHSFPGNYSWPKSLFMLDRCFLSTTFLLPNNKEFTIINTHNSAYDDGSLRQQQMNYLKDHLKTTVENKGSFLVGGDWNQSPSNFSYSYKNYKFDSTEFITVDENFLEPDWKFIYDKTLPSNRRLQKPLDKKTTKTTIIDYFLTSSEIEIISCKTIDLEFKNSDHNPVIISFRLK